MSLDAPATEFDIVFWINYYEQTRRLNFQEALGMDPWKEFRIPITKAVICETCEKNSQEGSDLFSLKGALEHCKQYCKPTLDGATHGSYREIDVESEHVATLGGLLDGPGCAYN